VPSNLGKWRVRWQLGNPQPKADEFTFLEQEKRKSDERPLTWLDLLATTPNLHNFMQSSKHALLALPAVWSHELRPTRTTPWKDPHIESLLALQSQMRLPPNIVPDASDALLHHDATVLVSNFAAHLKKNPRRAWDFVGAFRKKATATLPAASPEERVEKIHEHFCRLLAPPPEPFDLESLLQDTAERTATRIVWDTGPFTLEELKVIIARAKTTKSPSSGSQSSLS